MKIKITSDSTCDLSPELLEQNNISLFHLSVILGEKSYKDGKGITPQDIFDYVAQTGTLPKTAAGSAEEYAEFFTAELKGYDALIHFNISAKASSSHSAACVAAQSFGGKVSVIDSKALSTGQGLLVLKACDMVKEGMDAKTVVKRINELIPFVNTSFVPDSLDYLHKGGRCSLASMLGAKVLKLHPMIIEDKEGQLIAKKKYMGTIERCIKNYITELKEEYPSYDKTRCFITHSTADKSLVDTAKKMVAELFEFDEVIETVAGSIVTSHCGRNTLGVLFIYN
ncbi:MAG: DegV family protein [Candidatus Coproplasma sp.]